jgi:3-oxoacyl-[acyl-carrier protein] reductase
MDFLDAESVSKGLAEVRATSRDILALVNVAGIAEDATMHMLTSDALSRHLTVNFEAQVRITQYVTRLMLKSGGGAVVSVASVTGIDGNEGQLAYGASKAALISATRTMSMELGRHGIRVNAVAPGVIDTDMTRSLPNDVREELLTRPAMGRLGTPDEVAACIMWLCSPAASYVTGQTLRIDGGMT